MLQVMKDQCNRSLARMHQIVFKFNNLEEPLADPWLQEGGKM